MSLSRCGAALPILSLAFVKLLVPSGVRAYSGSASVSNKNIVFTSTKKMFISEERGSAYAPDFRVYFKDECGPISPLHDIPLWADKEHRIANMIVEVPRWSNAKMELSLTEPLNPIKQDVKKGALRFVANVFPHHGYIWNYGALPQTWENPQHIDGGTQARGDNDPIDVIEIGSRVASRGDVIQVKIVGTIALIDEGETDWKLVAIDKRDPLANDINDIPDVEATFPGLLKATVEWFRLYKVPDGKPPNQFAFNGEAKNAEFAHKIVDEVHEFWRGLINGDGSEGADINKMNVSVENSPYRVERAEASKLLAAAPPRSLPQQQPPYVDKWHFLSNI
ncbi:inorganic pyrophosphatase [Pectinophora gossypiella]|uniref:inorganic pyrophosphatase n=1 Tax=Pectinophora gossypiella TaxID=13191 RepID=UPI00214E5120|nr:inorganic pyrophosphatase [Pectinophora gossypiella]